ncbi:uncharacterized protein BDZ83DRAFT_653479 [Colletotrichum acutatum]|uniref:Uncharacterized protein n=1 Tax=Glomerella acutata TaxID=27357 RepID=A0AAD8UFE0_GLOAC|nr:uncharacterized protein BDZ83DRAFT_653479 [Colletotrichum acutatum]KAK1722916.1 hypothetical protein BDZ83DRAFT_653479 [Colletotrichum acutatum]
MATCTECGGKGKVGGPRYHQPSLRQLQHTGRREKFSGVSDAQNQTLFFLPQLGDESGECGLDFGLKQQLAASSADVAGVVDNEADIQGSRVAQDDALDTGDDPWEHENTFPPELYSSTGWDEQVDEVWNSTLRRYVTRVTSQLRVIIPTTSSVAATDRQYAGRYRYTALESISVSVKPPCVTGHIALHFSFII